MKSEGKRQLQCSDCGQFPSILFFCCVGTFSINKNLDEIYVTAAFGLLGYAFMRLGLEGRREPVPAPAPNVG